MEDDRGELARLHPAPAHHHRGRRRWAEGRAGNQLPQVEIAWQRIEPFSFTWPSTAGTDPDDVTEYHDPAFAATMPFRGRSVPVRIGFTDRAAAGRERKRVNVFLEV